MRNIDRFINWNKALKLVLMGIVVTMISCEFELPEAGSQPDNTPPKADFTITPDADESRLIRFTNTSLSATDFMWDFGDGNVSIDTDPMNLYPEEGTYTVTLVATDGHGVSNSLTKDIEVVVPKFYQPVILEPGFEDNTLPDGSGDGRDSWRAPDGSTEDRPLGGLGGVIQITGSPVSFGDQGAKLPNDNTRCGYQQVTVEPDTDYKLSFYYTMKDDNPAGTVTVYILDGPISEPSEVAGATITSVTVNDQSDPSTYVKQAIEFNSGASTAIVIYFINDAIEARLDEFSIEVL